MTERPIPGFEVHEASKGNIHVRIHAHADPRRDEAWLLRKRESYPSQAHFRREFMLDWTSSEGEAYYPEFMNDPKKYIWPCRQLIDAPVGRGWDFGWRGFACTWTQYSPRTDRLFVLRDLLVRGILTHAAAALVQYLSGEIDIEALVKWPRAMQVVNALEADPDPRLHPPWFEGHPSPQFVDYAGHEALKTSATVENESSAKSDADVLTAAGIVLGVYYRTPKARAQVLRRTLGMRPDGRPGFMVDPVCRETILGMCGGIAFAKATKENPNPEDAAHDGRFGHTHDSLGYVTVNTVPLNPPATVAGSRGSDPGRDSRTPAWKVPEDTLLIKEILRPNW